MGVGVPNVHFVGSCLACTIQICGIAEDRLNRFPKTTLSAALELLPNQSCSYKLMSIPTFLSFLLIDVLTHALDESEFPWKEIRAPPVRLNQSTEYLSGTS